MKSERTWIWMLLVSIACGLSALASVAWAGTYNFYFNNTEQGDNSTATPNVTVQDGKATKSDGKTTEAQEAKPGELKPEPPVTSEPLPAGASAPSQPGNVSTNTVAAEGYVYHEPKRFHLGVGVGPMMPTFPGGTPIAAQSLEMGYRFNREVGLNAFIMTHQDYQSIANQPEGGLEVEFMPIRLSFGKMDDLIQAGFMLGATTYGAAQGNFAAVYGGAKADVNLSDHWSLFASGRVNLGMLLTQAGVAIRI